MTISYEFWPTVVFGMVMLSWFLFAGVFGVFLLRKKPPSPPDSKREPASIVGIALQGLSYAIVWSGRRPLFTPIARLDRLAEIGLALLTIMAALASVWFVAAAVRSLGKQWSLAARVLQGHKLITTGPYRIVRNPIYTGMLGMLLATGLAFSHWIALAIGIPIFAIGTLIRVRSEEKLLREAFGEEFKTYAEHVPAVIPFLF